MATHVISARADSELAQKLEMYLHAKGGEVKRSDVLLQALELFLDAGTHARFAPPLPPVTESQMSGMRLRTLAILQQGGEHSPAELAAKLGCGENAAASYARDCRKGKYGGHNIISRQDVVNGRRTSFYRLEKGER